MSTAKLYKSIRLEDIKPCGELAERAELSLRRLNSADYSFDYAAVQTPQAPGDYIGRAILAEVLLWRTLNKKPVHLEEMIRRLPEILNPRGHVGEMLDKELIKELVVGGHNGFLRGLCEYYAMTGDEGVSVILDDVLKNLIIPFCDEIGSYPNIDPGMMQEGEQVALVWGRFGNWELSTDIGTIYLTLDGITHAYQLKPSPQLKVVIEKMIRRYSETDLLVTNAQTHSSLSALRGILRFYETTGCTAHEYLQLAEKVFNLYKNHAMTENYANFNWFERPEWTEPCAVVDSFTVAVWLWKLTGNSEYLYDAHHILYNALMAGQRPNGGFGCDSCVGGNGETALKVFANLYEAKFCCTMRGAEGLARAVEYGYFYSESKIVIPFMACSLVHLEFPDGSLILKQTGGYPLEGGMKLEVILSSIQREKELRIFMPHWIDRVSIKLCAPTVSSSYRFEGDFLVFKAALRTGDELQIDFQLLFTREAAQNKDKMEGYHRYFYGPVLLGCETGEEVELPETAEFEALGGGFFRAKQQGFLLKPANNLLDKTEEEAKNHSVQVLFRDSL